VIVEGPNRRGVAVLCLEPPHEAFAAVGERVDRIQRGHEAGQLGRVERGDQPPHVEAGREPRFVAWPPMDRAFPFSYPVNVRYLEVDQQGVVFNMWYLAYFDDAMTAFLAEGGLAYADMLAAGYDTQVVHTELDWHGSLGWGDHPTIEVGLAALGRTSFSLQFTVHAARRQVVTASTVYVVVSTAGGGKKPIPPSIREALGPLAPLRPVPKR
jgi:acyl-CoA thioester hydrolase